MAICVALQADGTLIPTGEAVEACTGYVLVSGSEHSIYALVQQALATPTSEQSMAWFVGTFGMVIFLYVASRMVGTVVAMFKS